MSDKKAVVIRHMDNSRPVTSAVIEESTDFNIDDMDHYLFSEARDHIRRFINNFPEFKNAKWYIDILNSSNGIIQTEVVNMDKI